MNKIYAGVGSRNTPSHILHTMRRYASKCADKGYMLRSGGAKGADKAFERGSSGMNIIYRPYHATKEAIEMSSKYHPNWKACNEYVRKLHARNCMILLGNTLDKPVGHVVCYTPDGKASGGTGQAIRIAEDMNIPVYNLFDESIQLPVF